MANIAIQLKVGSHPTNYKVGTEYHFQVGHMNTKVSSSDLLDELKLAVEDALKKSLVRR